ncbi:hypothetical protein HDU98_011744, partial [Podochytrium sp. JEL0797]
MRQPSLLDSLRKRLTLTIEAQSVDIALLQRQCPPIVLVLSKQMARLGTHTFYLAVLPVLFLLPNEHSHDGVNVDSPLANTFHGDKPLALSLVCVLALGVILSAVMKDFFCLPRPIE